VSRHLTTADLDGDGDADVVRPNEESASVAVVRNCVASGVAFCAGDGSGTACPCGNNSPPGSAAGCLHSTGVGATVRGRGAASLTHEELVLVGAQMPPTSSALYFQGTNTVSGGSGSPFGDGLRCAGGAIWRLGTKANVGGTSQYPGSGDPRISVRGAVIAPGTRTYQVWYRNAASFCTSSTFNLTNGLMVVWRT
jgi:hypothetical protein